MSDDEKYDKMEKVKKMIKSFTKDSDKKKC